MKNNQRTAPRTNECRENLSNTKRKLFWNTLLLLCLAISFTNPIFAACECVCLNGEVQAICDSTLDIRPICPPRICPIVTPSIPPIDTPRIPPIGTKECKSEQVYNERTQRYEWQRICR